MLMRLGPNPTAPLVWLLSIAAVANDQPLSFLCHNSAVLLHIVWSSNASQSIRRTKILSKLHAVFFQQLCEGLINSSRGCRRKIGTRSKAKSMFAILHLMACRFWRPCSRIKCNLVLNPTEYFLSTFRVIIFETFFQLTPACLPPSACTLPSQF
jgi:hypothetical protein